MVFVLDKYKKPLMPCSERRARILLSKGRAVVHKYNPFTIRLKDRTVEESIVTPVRVKLDPGSKVTGFAVVTDDNPEVGKVLYLGELIHKTTIKSKLDDRRMYRRNRRNRKTRYRKARFLNRPKPEGWLPPSLEAKVNQTINLVNKLRKLLPITAISVEHVKFDTQLMKNPEISGVEYQQGELQGYEVREYLLEKFGRKCAYCGKTDVPLEIEHIIPKSRGGTNRVDNLTIACHDCNQKKNNLTAEEFGYPEIQKLAKQTLKDVAHVNSVRWKLFNELNKLGLPVSCGTGARTKKQRIEHNLPKEHCYDACYVADTPDELIIVPKYVATWKYMGRGTRQMCYLNKYGFPVRYRQRKKLHFGFQTGDIVKVDTTDSKCRAKHKGKYTGRVTVRPIGLFDVKDISGKTLGNSIKFIYCQLLQRNDGWCIA